MQLATMPSQREMELAYQRGDASYDGIFFLGVRTTGVFCRPSCPARKPLPQNVEYFASVHDALFAGYRPCLRCRPLEVASCHPEWVRQLLDEVDRAPTRRIRDADLRRLGIAPERARRHFQRHYGMTFHAYARGRRLGEALTQIRDGKNLTDITLGHGYESHSGFRDAFVRTFGDTPGRSRSTDCITVSWIESPAGPLVAGATSEGICLLEFTDRRMLETQFDTLRARLTRAIIPGKHEYLRQLAKELGEYFSGARRRFDVPLAYPGTPFQVRVWGALLTIPYGETWSYADLAEKIGVPGAHRAVGHANGQNRVAIVIPCHRVVNKSGKLGGYGGGLWRKQLLLDIERGQGSPRPISEP
jgi:AraC family transcriptional regulator of adaptative response/methylated-DNA-[protein]-cysteine methyltransferase